jgi:anti-sigma B factor antagonist
MAQFEAKTTAEPDRMVVALTGECDLPVREEFASVLLDAVERAPLVEVDLGGLTFLDSRCIHGLITAHHAARERGGRVYVRHANGVVAEVLALTEVADLLRDPAEGGPDA